MAKKITFKRGTLRRFVVLREPPYPKIGDMITVNGEGGTEWFVSKVENTVVVMSIPLARAKAHA